MKLLIYVNYGGNCREAFEFYAQHLGGTITMVMTHGQGPDGGTLPPARRDQVLHARMDIGGTTLLGVDADPAQFHPMRSAYLTLMLDSVEEAERVYALLNEGGTVFMEMSEMFFAKRFAMLRDRFGTSWMLLHETATKA